MARVPGSLTKQRSAATGSRDVLGETRDALSDPRREPRVMADAPGIETAFEPRGMARRLQVALLGAGTSRPAIASCKPGSASYLPGEGILLRYEVALTDGSGGTRVLPVTARLVDSVGRARELLGALEPLVAKAREHPGLVPFRHPAAVLDDVCMVVGAFPIDAELPTLVEASDPRAMTGVLARSIGREVRSVRIVPVHYGRRHRCTLRYDLEPAPGDDGPDPVTVYGKVACDDRGSVALAALESLRERLREWGFRVPRPLGYLPGLRLLLLEALPGETAIGRLLDERLRGEGSGLEAAVESAAYMLARLHSGPPLGPRRRAEDEIAALLDRVAALREVAPEVTRRLERGIGDAAAALGATRALPIGLAHGDFSHKQIVVGAGSPGLLDFDTICRAEAVLDVGNFLAYLRLAALKAGGPEGLLAGEDHALRFLRTYVAERPGGESRDHVEARAGAYQTLSLVRIGVHSWQKLKLSRLRHVLALLEERPS
jgi:hypothetical protein